MAFIRCYSSQRYSMLIWSKKVEVLSKSPPHKIWFDDNKVILYHSRRRHISTVVISSRIKIVWIII